MVAVGEKPKILAVVGPTASGKTSLSVSLAEHWNGELVSIDSRQIFRGLDIGSGKELDLPVPQHLISELDCGERVTVAWYQERAYACIDEVLSRGKLPVLVGGSMQYISAILEGYTFGGRGHTEKEPKYEVLTLGLLPDRERLREKITERTKGWVEKGLEGEVQNLLLQGVSPEWIDALGLEYRAFLKLSQGEFGFEEAIEKSVTWQMQYAKRQVTWWRHHGEVVWVEESEEASRKISEFLHSGK